MPELTNPAEIWGFALLKAAIVPSRQEGSAADSGFGPALGPPGFLVTGVVDSPPTKAANSPDIPPPVTPPASL